MLASRRDWHRIGSERTLWVLCAAATALRLASALYQGSSVEPLPGVADQVSYHNLALRVIQGHGFSFSVGWWPATAAGEPTAHWSYLYAGFLALVYSLTGPDALAPRLIQAVIVGILQPVITFRIGKRFFGRRIGLVSAALSALNGYFIFYGGALMTESLYIVFMLWIIDISTAMPDHQCNPSSPKKWALLGLALGGATLLRQLTLLIVPIVLIWILLRVFQHPAYYGWRFKLKALHLSSRAAIATGVLAICILPWTVRNYRAFGSFVLLNTNAGFAFFWANHPIHGVSFIPLLTADKPTYGELIPAELRNLNEADMDRALMRRGLAFVWADPARYLQLSLSRAREYFKCWPSANSGRLSNYVRVASFGICLPFTLAGLAVFLFRPGLIPGYRNSARSSATFVLLICMVYTLIHLLSWSLIRYRLPVDAATLPFASLAIVILYDRLTGAARVAGSTQCGVES